jgi:tRNA dimethylallyltransferase
VRAAAVAVVGPTAAGKSQLGVAIAQAAGGEVVNADSMQLYRGMDIGTAKLPEADRAGVPHHLLDIWRVTDPASVAAYQHRARACLDDLLGRGVTPVVVGGSGLYLRAALDDIDFPGTDPALRAELAAELAERGAAALHARLADIDPAAAAAILPSNGRRIVRALEVVALTGSFQATLPPPVPAYDGVRYVGLDAPDLDERIGRRVEQMYAGGLLDEVRRLERAGLRDGRTASRAVGYAQALAVLDGTLKEEQARAETGAATRRLARRQRSWFRRDSRVLWFGPQSLRDVLRTLDAV